MGVDLSYDVSAEELEQLEMEVDEEFNPTSVTEYEMARMKYRLN